MEQLLDFVTQVKVSELTLLYTCLWPFLYTEGKITYNQKVPKQSMVGTQLQQITLGYIQLSSMVIIRYVLGPFCQLPFHLIASIVPTGIPLVCEKLVIYMSQYWHLKVVLLVSLLTRDWQL